MLKGELRGESKKRPFGRPLITGVLENSSSPVQTAKNQALHTSCEGFFSFIA